MYAVDYAQVGANIQKQLNIRGVKQQELADALSISKQVMNKIVKGHKAINVNELACIASALDTTADKLLTISDGENLTETLSFMGKIRDEETREKVDLIRSAIDEIHLLEEIADAR